MYNEEAIQKTRDYMITTLSIDSSGHDHFHVDRVWRMAKKLAHEVGANTMVVELTALLHDISDYKLNGGDEKAGPEAAKLWIESIGIDKQIANNVADIIEKMSFKGAKVVEENMSIEGQVVQDADRLDAIGAIGIARAFAFGGAFGQRLHDPDIIPVLHENFEAYKKKKDGTTINHFFEKLLLLKDRMNTAPAKRIAEQRHKFMEMYLNNFMQECKGSI